MCVGMCVVVKRRAKGVESSTPITDASLAVVLRLLSALERGETRQGEKMGEAVAERDHEEIEGGGVVVGGCQQRAALAHRKPEIGARFSCRPDQDRLLGRIMTRIPCTCRVFAHACTAASLQGVLALALALVSACIRPRALAYTIAYSPCAPRLALAHSVSVCMYVHLTYIYI
jgi:hypothetical protein